MSRRNTAHVDHRLISIVDEMLTFFYSLRAEDIKMEIGIEDTHTDLTFSASIKAPIEPKRLAKIKKLLASPRAHEMEEYYWGLTGNDMTPSTELSLVGMMIDDFEIEYQEGSGDFFIRMRRDNIHLHNGK